MVKGGVPERIDLDAERSSVLALLHAIQQTPDLTAQGFADILRRYPRPGGTYAKSQLLEAYRRLVQEGAFPESDHVEHILRGRPVRTISGVAPVAVLTEPYPCPGECIFCPDNADAPKSYLDGEPGVLRAIQNTYDPYAQTHARIQALQAIGHPTDKVELLILGGTWSAYPPAYRERFLRSCFEAMNGQPHATLESALEFNAAAPHRNVGLVVETRPDCITPDEVLHLRQEGVTKVQIGAQSLDDRILALNQRGHTLADLHRALDLLRLAGFKTVLHWMPNLYGATLESDLEDFHRLWDDPGLRPDELKIYPTALLAGTALYTLWERGQYRPYEESELIELLIRAKQSVPPYCRINRLMRDIPAHYIVEGTTKSNLRQIVQRAMRERGLECHCIRCREVRGEAVDPDTVGIEVLRYDTQATEELFIQSVTPSGRLAGFLRLSLPKAPRTAIPIAEIREAAMIREVHVYGPAQDLGERGSGMQHQGLGGRLLDVAAEAARAAGFAELAVIAAAGTVMYYRERGFVEGKLYPLRRL